MVKVNLYPFGDVNIVSSLKDIPDGDFGSASYEGTMEKEYTTKYAGLNIYSIVDSGNYIYYGVF